MIAVKAQSGKVKCMRWTARILGLVYSICLARDIVVFFLGVKWHHVPTLFTGLMFPHFFPGLVSITYCFGTSHNARRSLEASRSLARVGCWWDIHGLGLRSSCWHVDSGHTS